MCFRVDRSQRLGDPEQGQSTPLGGVEDKSPELDEMESGEMRKVCLTDRVTGGAMCYIYSDCRVR